MKCSSCVYKIFTVLFTGGLLTYGLATHLIISATPSAGARVLLRRGCPETLRRFQLLEFLPPENDPIVPRGIKLIKHAVCFPGERIVRQGKHFLCLTRKGRALDLGPVKFRTRDGRPLTPWLSEKSEAAIPPGHIFVAGDGTPHSYDSRYFGPIPMKRVLSCPVPLF